MNICERKIVAWSIEWEGSIQLNSASRGKGGNYHIVPRVSIVNTSEELLETFREIVKVGYVNPIKYYFIWQLHRQGDIREFLEEILPYLITKKLRAEAVIAYCELRLSHSSLRHPYTEEEWELTDLVCRLNKRGKEALVIAK